MNIAVVDDEEIVRQQIHGFIKRQKSEFYISDFTKGEEVLAAKADFDIFFFDIQMEGVGGIEAGRRKGQKEQQIFIKTKNQGYTFNLSSILYIENREKKVEIRTTDMEEIIETYATMNELDKADRESHGIGLANIKSTLKSIREQWILR